MKLTSPPVKDLAISLGLQVFQPNKVNQETSFEFIQEWNPDLIVVAAYGQILKPKILNYPKYGCINVHASLLPRWRGASPIQSALVAGDPVTGVTIMKMDVGMDTGDILGMLEVPIQSTDTGGLLTEKLSVLGAEYLLEVLPDYIAGKIAAVPQPDTGITYASLIRKQDGQLDPNVEDAATLERKVRAYQPWPGAFLEWEGGRLKVLEASIVSDEPGTDLALTIKDGWPMVTTLSGCLRLDVVQPAGKNCMTGKQFLLGAKNWATFPSI
jgi:methionyl-tRNA formyltransferase